MLVYYYLRSVKMRLFPILLPLFTASLLIAAEGYSSIMTLASSGWRGLLLG